MDIIGVLVHYIFYSCTRVEGSSGGSPEDRIGIGIEVFEVSAIDCPTGVIQINSVGACKARAAGQMINL